MPRDCPRCGIVNPDSAPTCDCGYPFDQVPTTPVSGPEPPSAFTGCVCAVFVLVGLGILAVGWFSGTIPESELVRVEGVPGDIRMSRLPLGRNTPDILAFTVAGYRLEYGSDSPKYEAVLKAVRRKEPIQLWVSPKRSPSDGVMPFYKMRARDKPVLAYVDTVKHDEKGSTALGSCGGFAVALGLWGACLWYRERWRYNAWVRLQTAVQLMRSPTWRPRPPGEGPK